MKTWDELTNGAKRDRLNKAQDAADYMFLTETFFKQVDKGKLEEARLTLIENAKTIKPRGYKYNNQNRIFELLK